MDPKALKKLVKTCREMGITHYKGVDFEFTLSHDAPQKKVKNHVSSRPTVDNDSGFETDTLTEDQLLMWSAAPGGAPFAGEQEEGQ